MPRLQDLLEYLARPGLEDVWVLLDIKVRKKISVVGENFFHDHGGDNAPRARVLC
jgi:hypothetical protein